MPSKLNDLNRPVSANSSILKKTDNDASKLNQRIDRYKANEIKTKNDQEISKKDNNNKDTAQNSQDYQNPKIENLRKKLIEPSLQNESLNSNLKNTKKPTDQSKVLTKPKDIKNAKDEPDTSEVKIVEEKPVEKLKPVKVTISPKGNFNQRITFLFCLFIFCFFLYSSYSSIPPFRDTLGFQGSNC